MLKKATPSRRRRTCGHLLVALTSLVVGYAAWAAEPDGAEPTTSAASPTNELRGSRLTMMLESNRKVDYQADQMNVDKEDHVVTLEGHVRIVVHRTPSEQVTTDPRSVIIEGDKVVITPQAAGGSKVEIENGSIQEL